ncbi:chorion peroxidase-like isoform X2 [Octopus vulgaris]|uniref:Chorion peroxidase-like isoform X2 n=1 Tax=Octopus vulgaris TaxID=6645 RepID=A0AA36BPU0_OCTVU|nr:chorion peroxidase-like isoform X2 [Octopus vulgaris]
MNISVNNPYVYFRYVTDELTNKYLENIPGTGIDLAADLIQRGRDHGIMSYPMWTIKTGEPHWSNFKSLTSHSTDNQARLSQMYRNIYDIDLWTAGISEIPVLGGKVGLTFGKIIAEQFQVLKKGDRFWYENNDKGAFSKASGNQESFTHGNLMSKHTHNRNSEKQFCCSESEQPIGKLWDPG